MTPNYLVSDNEPVGEDDDSATPAPADPKKDKKKIFPLKRAVELLAKGKFRRGADGD
ncbi:MAG: hypothetical protein WKF37_09455 [Bryobacteraceae bacterium]